MIDDRVHCDRQCDNYLGFTGQCGAAVHGLYKGVTAEYRPTLGVPRRCEYFQPKPGAADQRSAMERWPSLFDVDVKATLDLAALLTMKGK
jgi:hypothetical protein